MSKVKVAWRFPARPEVSSFSWSAWRLAKGKIGLTGLHQRRPYIIDSWNQSRPQRSRRRLQLVSPYDPLDLADSERREWLEYILHLAISCASTTLVFETAIPERLSECLGIIEGSTRRSDRREFIGYLRRGWPCRRLMMAVASSAMRPEHESAFAATGLGKCLLVEDAAGARYAPWFDWACIVGEGYRQIRKAIEERIGDRFVIVT